MIIRTATTQDADIVTIVHQRKAMFLDMGYADDAELAEMCRLYPDWVRPKIETGDYMAWFMVDEDKPIAGAAMLMYGWGPRPGDLTMRRGYIMNVFVEPDYRRQGLARQLVTHILDWSRGEGLVTLILHASDKGRPLYESLGFNATKEMQLKL